MAKKTSRRGSDLWDDSQLAEKPARKSNAVTLSDRQVKATRFYTKICLWAVPLVAVLGLVIYSEMGNEPVQEQQKITNQVDSAGKAAAIVAVNDWLEAIPAPLTDGEVVSWDGFDSKAAEKVAENLTRVVTNPEYGIEVHHFTLVDGQGTRYNSDVAVAVDEVNGTTVLGSPSLTPIAPSADGWASGGVWYGLKSEQSTDSVMVAINQWAKAFTSGDPDVLRATVGDPDPSHSYMPLTGVSEAVPTFVQGGSVPTFKDDGSVSNAAAKTLIVQVQLQLTWADAAEIESGSQEGSSLITYDLLIQGADTAAPVVVAWGGAGSGTQLKAYDQAIVDRSLTTEEND